MRKGLPSKAKRRIGQGYRSEIVDVQELADTSLWRMLDADSYATGHAHFLEAMMMIAIVFYKEGIQLIARLATMILNGQACVQVQMSRSGGSLL